MNGEQKPKNHLVEGLLQALQQEYVVVGKTNVSPWHAWLIIGAFAGVILGMTFVANRGGEFEKTKAGICGSVGVPVAMPEESQLTTLSDVLTDGLSHDIFGDKIVTLFRGSISLFDIEAKTSRRLVGDVVSRPRIWGSKVVYAAVRNGDPGIFLFDIETNSERRITNRAGQNDPLINGDRVIWLDSRNGKADLFLFDLVTNQERRITSDEAQPVQGSVGGKRSYDISGDKIVWLDLRGGIFLFDLAKNKERQITFSPASPNSVAISGNRIVWLDNDVVSNSEVFKKLMLFDLSTNQTRRIPTSFSVHENPAIDGDLIVWTGFKDGLSVVYLFDLATETEHTVRDGICDSNMPRISGRRIIFRDIPNSALTLAEHVIRTPAAFAHTVGDWDRDGSPDLIAVKKNHTGSQSTEVHILSGASNYQQFLMQTGTPLSETESNFAFTSGDWDRDGIPDLIVVEKKQAGPESIKVRILSGAKNFQKFILQTVTPLHEIGGEFAFTFGDWDKDGTPDLIAVKKNQTDSKSTEVYVLSGAKNFQKFILQTRVPLGETSNNFELTAGDWDRDGIVDLIAIKKNQPLGPLSTPTGPQSTEVTILSGASNFQKIILQTGTALHETGLNFTFVVGDFDRDGIIDLIAVKKNHTGTHTTEIHILSGASNFQKFILQTGSALHET